MKRNASGERWGKASKKIVRNTNKIVDFLKLDQPNTYLSKMKKKLKKEKEIYNVWDTIRLQALRLYSPKLKIDDKLLYRNKEDTLQKIFRDNSRLWWLNHQVDITIESLITEWKVTTYYWKYIWMDVAVEDRFYKIIKISWT